MKVILVMVSTINGKTTFKTAPGTSQLASPEDQKYFSRIIAENNLLIMGRKTYEAARNSMLLSHDRLRIILTHEPEKYQDRYLPNQLEFSSDEPVALLKRLENRGFSQAILLGGEVTNTDFLKDRLVDEIWLTVEPKLFGMGNNLLSEADFAVDLTLCDSKKLNTNGTLLLKYKVVK